MTLGLMISALSVRACSDGSSTAVSLPPLVALLTLPLLDVVTAIGRRSITGRSVFTPDRGHIHHCLRSRLGSTVAALGAAVGLATLGAGGAALVKVDGSGDLAACLAIVISVGLLVGTNTFGRSESRLLLFRIRTALTPLLTGGAVRQGGIQQGCHLHGIRDWAGVWDALIREVEDGGVWRIELAIDMAAAGEVYHGLWILPAASGDDQSWSVVHNLYAGGVPAGVLHVAGSIDASRSHHLAKVEELVRMLEDQLGSDVPPPSSAVVPSPSCVTSARRARADVTSDELESTRDPSHSPPLPTDKLAADIPTTDSWKGQVSMTILSTDGPAPLKLSMTIWTSHPSDTLPTTFGRVSRPRNRTGRSLRIVHLGKYFHPAHGGIERVGPIAGACAGQARLLGAA